MSIPIQILDIQKFISELTSHDVSGYVVVFSTANQSNELSPGQPIQFQASQPGDSPALTDYIIKSSEEFQEDIDQQLQLLKAHRKTLFGYVLQKATMGASHVPPHVLSGISEARESIRRIKRWLERKGVVVENHRIDEED